MHFATEAGGTKGEVFAYPSLTATTPIGTERFTMTATTPTRRGDFKRDYGELLAACQRLRNRLGQPIEGVGFSLAGKHDRDRTTLLTAGNLDHWSNQPFVGMLEQELGCRVVLGGDGEAAVLAEALFGLGQDPEFKGEDIILVIWGTGIGGGAVFYAPDGTIVLRALELGHQHLRTLGLLARLLRGKKDLCGCGQRGCLEAFCGGNGIRRRFGKGAEHLSERQWRKVVDDMVLGLRGVLTVSPVGLLAFSGGQPCKDEWLLPRLEARLTHPMLGGPRLRLSKFGETAGMLGALSLLSLPEERN